ncbi:MAG: hypothetical protein GX861_03165, partial [Tenericutes bacterium]|nr:hypothetical protein [Mycoplasmatota bacterium]
KDGTEIVKELDIISVSSTTYDLTKNYINVGIETLNINKIVVTNGIAVVNNNKVQIKYGDTVVKAYDIVGFSSTVYDLKRDNIIVFNTDNNTTILNNITVSNCTKEISDNKLIIKFEGNILKEYNISKITVNALLNNLDMQKGLIKGITVGSKVNILNDITVTNGTISKLDKKNVPISDTSNLKTGDKLRITFSDNSYYDYTVSVKGDVVGSGEINIASVAKLYQYLKGVITMDEAYVEAGDLVGPDGIEINDIAKLYQYIKGTISTL